MLLQFIKAEYTKLKQDMWFEQAYQTSWNPETASGRGGWLWEALTAQVASPQLYWASILPVSSRKETRAAYQRPTLLLRQVEVTLEIKYWMTGRLEPGNNLDRMLALNKKNFATVSSHSFKIVVRMGSMETRITCYNWEKVLESRFFFWDLYLFLKLYLPTSVKEDDFDTLTNQSFRIITHFLILENCLISK